MRISRTSWVLLAVLIVLINVPLVHAASTAGRPDDAIAGEETFGSGVRDAVVFVDTVIAGGLMLWLRFRFRHRDRRKVERVEALGDVRPGRIRAVWQDLGDGTVRVNGMVLERDEDEILLDAGDRLVRVRLDGHYNFVSDQEPAQLRVRLTDPT